MKKSRFFIRTASLLLCLLLVGSLQAPAFAEGNGIIDAAELQRITEELITSHNLKTGDVSIGFCYTATGDKWYYNEGEWYYAASMYKVPLMMLMAEKLKSGELTDDTDMGGMSLGEVMKNVLVYSNNEWAHVVRNYLGGDKVWREQTKKYASIPDADYDPDFIEYGYVNPVYETEMLETLFKAPEDYPEVLDYLKEAEPGHYFRRNLEGQYEIAQKYGSLKEFFHTCGVIYTPHPILLTVMTKNCGNFEAFIGDAAEVYVNYALTLDEKLPSYKAEKPAEESAEKTDNQAEALTTEEGSQSGENTGEATQLQQNTQHTELDIPLSDEAESSKNLLFGLIAILFFMTVLVLLVLIVLSIKNRVRKPKKYPRY